MRQLRVLAATLLTTPLLTTTSNVLVTAPVLTTTSVELVTATLVAGGGATGGHVAHEVLAAAPQVLATPLVVKVSGMT